jgi:cytochrome c-type biogenesis protein
MNPSDIAHLSTVAALLLTFVGGVVTGFNPCCYTMLPAIMGYLCGYCQPSTKRCAWLSTLFAAGLATATALLGLIVVLVGGYFGGIHPAVKVALALVPVVMGLQLLGVINIKLTGLQRWKPVSSGALGAYLTGLIFSLVILPCATPVLASILSYAAGRGSVLYGSSLLLIYGAGIGAPLVIFGTSIGLVSSLRSVSRWWSVVNRVSGVILIGLGFYLLWRA